MMQHDLVVGYCEPWDTPLKTSKHHLVKYFAKMGWRVLYLESPITPFNVLKNPRTFYQVLYPRIKQGVEQVEENIWRALCWVPCPCHVGLGGVLDQRLYNELNQRFTHRKLRSFFNTLAFDNPNWLVYYPHIYPLLQRLPKRNVVFHMVDEWQGMQGLAKTVSHYIHPMLSLADHSVVSARSLYDCYHPNHHSLRLLRHGIDQSLFNLEAAKQQAPLHDLPACSGPRIGYYGALHKLDFALIEQVARERPAYQFVLLGPRHGGQGLKRQRPSLPDNVFLLDPLPWHRLPAFLLALDVVWMPFETNLMTQHMSPIKLFEVLNMGKAVVLSDLTECREIADGLCYFAKSVSEHVAAIDKALVEPDRLAEERITAMQPFTWEHVFQSFQALFTNALLDPLS